MGSIGLAYTNSGIERRGCRLDQSGKIFSSWLFIFDRVRPEVLPLAILSSCGDRFTDMSSLCVRGGPLRLYFHENVT